MDRECKNTQCTTEENKNKNGLLDSITNDVGELKNCLPKFDANISFLYAP